MHPLDRHFRTSHRRVSIGGRHATTDADTSAGGGSSSGRRRPAGTLISWRGSCSSKVAGSTPSVRRGMRATPWLRWRRVRPIRHCSTTARGRSTWPEPDRCRVDASPRRVAGADGPGRRAHCRRPAQGFGHPELAVIPQTSTVASHLPRAVGLAIALQRAHRLRVDCEWPEDAVVVCSFGDASANHSTAAGAINTALATAFRGLPVPILFVCEDNGFGISVPTPKGWIETAYGSRPGLAYVAADGSDPATAWPAIVQAVDTVREQRRPVFLHLRCVRFGGHAGSDAEISYRKPREIEADYARDPLLATASCLRELGASASDILACYDTIRLEIDDEANGSSTSHDSARRQRSWRRSHPATLCESRRLLLRSEPLNPWTSQVAHTRRVDQCHAR